MQSCRQADKPDRQTDRQAGRQPVIKVDMNKGRQTDYLKHAVIVRKIDKQSSRQADTDRQADIQTDKQAHRQAN
jgi:hypothetical protein